MANVISLHIHIQTKISYLIALSNIYIETYSS